MAATERRRAMPRSVFFRLRAERLEAVLRELNALLQGARIGPLKAGYPGASASAMFRLEAARDKALAMVEALDAEMEEGGDD